MDNNVIKFRRDLHKIPELDFDLPKTTTYLTDYLSKLPCTITKIGKASFVAFFDAGKDKTIAFRTDMDALPVTEKTGHDFSSEHEGQMHACGHDGHMSIMLGLATEVAKMLSNGDLKTNVLLVFQAAEETSGGAEEICDSGVFLKYNTKKIYGLHIWPEFPKNTIVCKDGPLMAGTRNLWINIDGKSAHAANPKEGIDALDIGVRLISDIYKMEQDDIPGDEVRILKICEFNSGTGTNIISGRSEMSGTIRFLDLKTMDLIYEKIRDICSKYEKDYQCSIELILSEGYPPVINPPEMVEDIKDIGFDFFQLDASLMTSEDFSSYQRRIPGLFFFLGTGLDLPLHNGYYDIDEEVLPAGVEIFKALLLADQK